MKEKILKKGITRMLFSVVLAVVISSMQIGSLTAYAASYNITIATADNGTVTGPASAEAGVTVTLSANPSSGYKLDSITGKYKYNTETIIPKATNETVTGKASTVENSAATLNRWPIHDSSKITVKTNKAGITISKLEFHIIEAGKSFAANNFEVTSGRISVGTSNTIFTINNINSTSVTLNVKPSKSGTAYGCKFDQVTVTYSANVEEDLTINQNPLSFTMPDGNVTITPSFVADHAHNYTYEALGATITAKTNCHTQTSCEYYTTGEKTVSLTLSANDTDYSGSAIPVTVTAQTDFPVAKTESDVVYYESDGTTLVPTTNSGASEAGKAPKLVGSYVAKLTITTADGAAEDTTASVNYSIGKAAPTATAPTAKTLTYNGEAQALVNVGSTSHGTLQYALTSDGTFTTDIPTGTNAGSYNVYYKVVGDGNHSDKVFDTPVSVTISKATYGGTKTATGNILAGYASSDVEVTLPEIPEHMAYGTPSFSSPITSATIEDGKVKYNANNTAVAESPYTITVPVSEKSEESANYSNYNITVTLTGFNCDHSSTTPVSEVAATCTLDGVNAHDLCSVCGSKLIGGVVKTDEELKITKLDHNWEYNASGATLTATCSRDSSHTATLTLTATSAKYSGSTTGWCEADKVAFELVGKDAWESAVGTAPTIQYTGTTIDGTAYTSEDKPTVGGSYTAYIECDEKKAELSFLVGHVFEGQPYVDVEDGIHHNQKCKYCDNVNQGNHDFSDEGICKICNYECTHQNAEGWTVEDGKCTSCGAEIAYPVDDEGKPVVIDKVPDQLWVTGIRQNLKFTGAKVEQPTMKVYWKNKLLVINQDYTVKYLNNIKAGTATVVITGKGNYAGTIKETYPIKQIDIGSAKAFDEEITIAANGKIQKPTTTFTIEAGGKTVTLKNGTDYTYTYPVIKDKGEYEVTITGKGNYKETKTVKVTVVEEGVAVTKLTVKKIPNQTYRDEDNDGKGDQIIPEVVVTYGKKILENGNDYTVEVVEGANTDIGIGTVTIVGNSENGYYGKRNVSFNIVGTPITKASVEGLVAETYTGNAINPTGYKLYIRATRTTEQIDLTENKDYKVSVDKNVNAGTATVRFTGINGYSGVLKKTFKINKASMTDARISIKPIDAVQYQKNGAKPAITVTDGSKVLKENVDYTVRYTNNNALHDLSNEVKKPTVTITGKGNYMGTKSANFAIIGSSLSKDDITITATDIVAKNRANTCRPVIKLTDNGVALRAGTDYETVIEYTYENDTKVKQIVNRVETEVEYVAGAKVNTADIIPAGTEIRATVKGKGFYADSKEVVFRYVAANIASAKIVIPSFVYSGKAITLDENKIQVTMVVNKKAETLEFGRDFEIIGYKNNVNKGTAKVTIRGLGNYGGTKEVTFKIVSKTLNHTVRLHNNDGSGKDVVREINIPSGTKLPVNKFKVAGKKFAGWNTEADGSGKAYNDRETIVRSNLSMLIFGDTLDLYAQWE